MQSNAIVMLGFYYLVLNLFTWWSLVGPMGHPSNVVAPPTGQEEVVATHLGKSQATVEVVYDVNHLLETSPTSKLPFPATLGSMQAQTAAAVPYGPRLLYLRIGRALELQFVSSRISFPFHCFT